MQSEGSPSQTPVPTSHALVDSPTVIDANMHQAAEPPAPSLPSGFPDTHTVSAAMGR